jgi:hypothetical protein
MLLALPPPLLPPLLGLFVNSCCGTRPLLAALLLLPLLLLIERVRRCVLLLPDVRWSRICFRDRSDMVLSRLGVVGADTGVSGDSPAAASNTTSTKLSVQIS